MVGSPDDEFKNVAFYHTRASEYECKKLESKVNLPSSHEETKVLSPTLILAGAGVYLDFVAGFHEKRNLHAGPGAQASRLGAA